MKTRDYIYNRNRICKIYNRNCSICPLFSSDVCFDLNAGKKKIDDAISVVKEWMRKHKEGTMIEDFIQKHPGAILKRGIPDICPYELGYSSLEEDKGCFFENRDCVDCWNRLCKK